MANPAVLNQNLPSLKQVLKFLILIPFIAYASSLYAQKSLSNEQLKTYSDTFDKIERNLKYQKYEEEDISALIKEVSSIKSESVDCANSENITFEKLKKDLASLGDVSKSEPVQVKKKRKELNDAIILAEKNSASCQVFVLRSDEALKNLSAAQQQLLADRLFAKGPSIKKLLQNNLNNPLLWLSATHAFLLNDSGTALFSIEDILILLVVIFAALFSGLFLHKKIVEKINKNNQYNTFSNQFLSALFSVSGFYLPHLFVSLSSAIFCFSITGDISPIPFISVVTYGLPVYFLMVILVEVFLAPRLPATAFHNFPDKVAVSLVKRLKVFLLLLFIGYLFFVTLLTRSIPEETLFLVRSLLIMVFVINLVWAVRILDEIPRFAHTFIIRFGISLFLLSILVIELLGYRNLSGYIIFAVFGSSFAVGTFLLLSRLLAEFFDGLNKGKRKWQRSLRESLGVKSRKKLPELLWIRMTVLTGLWIGLIILILKMWGLSDAGFQQLNMIIFDGFTVGSLKIIPIRILFALITLTLLLAISRWFRARLELSWLTRTNMDRGAREAMATISGYLGVAISLLVSLSIAGVEFGNVAIIAGALSVGIGFGLQNIVNNFVSGLILLFERPIKTGDWIIVGNTEGYVKKISIRSTQIQTFDQADVIVPNSDLISGQVTNWMLRDVRGRIRIPIGVAYGSDTMLVQKLLLDIANQNPVVITDGSSPEPKVLFISFGDSALLFELRVFIQNIDKRFQAASDLNFAIDAAFREHNIQIPFPQRDVHIHNVPGDVTDDKKKE